MAKRVDPLKAKQAKQKKVAIGLCVLLAGVVAFQGPKMLKMMKGPQPAAVAEAAAPAATPTATGGCSGRHRRCVAHWGTGRAGAGGSACGLRRCAGRAERAVALDRQLLDQGSVRAASHRGGSERQPGPGQRLRSAGDRQSDRLRRPCRHVRSARLEPAGSGSERSPGEHHSVGRPARHGDGDHDLDQRRDGKRRHARRKFPAADPVFVLESLATDGKSVEISVAGGSYSNGKQTIKLQIGKRLTLQNTSDGSRYDLELLTVAGFVPPKK